MPWRINGLCLGLLLLAGAASAASLPELWPLQPDPAVLSNQLAAARVLPNELTAALKFQKTFCAILASAPITTWRADLERFAQLTGEDPITPSIRAVAHTWLARVWMQDVDAVLREYYRHNVRYPDTLAALGKELPEALRVDPWGEPWAYATRTPPGFARQTNQRYLLGPKRNPNLGSLFDAVQNRRPPAMAWKITPQEVAGLKSLQFKSATATALLQPGGTVEGYNLLFIGDGWALLAGADQLFAVTF